MNHCQFSETDRGVWTCQNDGCGYEYCGPVKPKRNCGPPPEPVSEATLTEAAEKLGVSLGDVKHYARAVWRWKKAGYPKRTTEEIELIFETYCKPCDDNIKGRCKHCGCNVSKSKFTLLNKIKMRTETCKLGKWPEVEEG